MGAASLYFFGKALRKPGDYVVNDPETGLWEVNYPAIADNQRAIVFPHGYTLKLPKGCRSGVTFTLHGYMPKDDNFPGGDGVVTITAKRASKEPPAVREATGVSETGRIIRLSGLSRLCYPERRVGERTGGAKPNSFGNN